MGCNVLYIIYRLQLPPTPLSQGDGGSSHFSGFYRTDIDRIGIFGEDWYFRWGDFFQVGLENSKYKNMEYKSQTKKMILIPNILFVVAKWFLYIL